MASNDQIRAQAHASFRFVVDIEGERQAAFTECTLPSIEWDIEDVKEGGLNTYTHQLPGRRKATKVSLKNGVGKSQILDWYIKTMSESVTRKSVTITLVDSTGNSVLVWDIKDACPVKWTGPQLKTDANSIAIQTLELACGEIVVSEKK